jgi:hypothetical protein
LIGVIHKNQEKKLFEKKPEENKTEKKKKKKTAVVDHKNSAMIDHYCKLILIELAHI